MDPAYKRVYILTCNTNENIAILRKPNKVTNKYNAGSEVELKGIYCRLLYMSDHYI